MMRIEIIGQIWRSLTNGMVYSTQGLSPTLCCGAHNGVEPKILITEDNIMKTKLNRYVRYIYRKVMKEKGVEQTREQALRLYVLTTKARDEERPSNEFINALLDLCIEWGITPKMGIDPADSLYADLTPIRVRIRKLTERECFRLMDVRDADIDKMLNSGISRSAAYKLAGNSIVCACLMGIFTQLFRADSDSLF